MPTSKFLSKILGFYFIIMSSAMFADLQRFLSAVIGLINDAPLLFICGVITVILGLLMVVSHNRWELNWRIVITIICWWVLIKGLLLIFYPQLLIDATQSIVQNTTQAYLAAAIDLVLGLFLVCMGFKK